MALSNEENRLVLATGNKSEVAMGYCTLYGDTVGAIDPLADLFKTEVYEIARYLNKRKEIIPEETITRAPSAELRPGQKDEDELPPYEKLDKIVRLYLEENKSAEELVEAGFDSNMVEKAIRRIEINEYKRRQLPMGIKISECSFFIDRKMPIVRKPL
jgi:NAD+ synthase (glutamine-hydrolysing)